MSEAIAEADARRAVDAHDRLIAALYAGELIEIDGARLTHNRFIEELEWNHAGRVALPEDDDEAIDRLLADVSDFFAARRRTPSVLLDPFTYPPDFAAELSARGWSEAYRHAGLIFPAREAVAEIAWPASAAIAESTRSAAGAASEAAVAFPSMKVFASVFEASFAETADGDLSAGYFDAFPAAMARPAAGVEAVHTLVTIDGEPAAVGSRALADGVAGLYNLGVAPRFRRHGLGGAITLHRVREARAAGAEVVYLLTEDPRVEAAQLRRGFVKAFELAGWRGPENGAPRDAS
jgi:ribosomal protein S18 acetylase RimI-like enzyme